MGLPRSQYVQEGQEGVYHCFSRCVRRAFLCGLDSLTGRDFSHRKAWLLERLRTLAAMFAIEVCAYAIMATHYHLILRIRPDIVALWSDREVARRWLMLFPRRRDANPEQWFETISNFQTRFSLAAGRLSSLRNFAGRLGRRWFKGPASARTAFASPALRPA